MEKMEQGALSQLVRDSQAGDSQARERLVLSVQDYVHFYCRVMTDNPDDAMDAAQDILIAMLTGLKGLKDPEAFWGWLRQIVIRTCRKRTSRTRREQGRHKSLEAMQEEFDSGLTGPSELEELVENQEVRRTVMDLVNALPPQQRMCVLLFYYEEMPVEDIAAALHVPEGTVKSRLYYARKAIRRGAERSAQQGLPLYGLSPLPFLGAVLQREAAAAAGSAVPAGLAQAAFAAGGTAAGITAKTVLSALAGKKAAILAGLAVAAVVTGSVLLTPEAPAVKLPAPPAVVQEVPPAQPAPPAIQGGQPSKPVLPPPQEPENPVRQEAFTQPETARPAALPAAPVNETVITPLPPAEEEAPVDPEVQEPVSHEPQPPQEELGSEPLPEIILESLSKPDAPPETKPDPLQPSWNPGFNLPVDMPQPIIPPAQDDPEPVDPEPVDPEPVDPEPVDPEPIDPEPVDPEPVDPEPVDPEPDEPEETVVFFETSFYDGGGNGGYGYTTTFSQAWANHDYLPPVEATYTSSDPSVAAINEDGEFTTLAPGTAVLSAAMNVAEGIVFQYDLTVTVEDEFRWLPWLPDCALMEGDTDSRISLDNLPAEPKLHLVSAVWHSSDSKVASVHTEDSDLSVRIHPGVPGEAVITVDLAFQVDTVVGTKEMGGSSSFTVTVEPDPSRPEFVEHREELTEFGSASGYGYTRFFREMWYERLPETLTDYTSSDPDVVCILETGEFSTLSAGTAELTAVDPDDPEHPYTLILHVQDHLDWTRSIDNDTAWLDLPRSFNVVNYSKHLDKRPIFSVWESGDTSVVTIEPSGYWAAGRLTGKALGETDVTVTFFFEVQTVVGTLEMQDTLKFHVTVVP